jgi:mono/diheme cytochrome c family protein
MNVSRALAIFVMAAVLPAQAQAQQDAAAIRAGRNLATSTCFACHVVSPNQALSPVLGPGIPSFQQIADRPDITAESLMQRMKTATWHDDALPPTLLPMSHLSDKERSEVATYILSLRTQN